uniref:Uncharacterized protein n=1 Tax=Anguilla anguilla TaxID=7936 RepID=A0A0E9WLK0_ANGAN
MVPMNFPDRPIGAFASKAISSKHRDDVSKGFSVHIFSSWLNFLSRSTLTSPIESPFPCSVCPVHLYSTARVCTAFRSCDSLALPLV